MHDHLISALVPLVYRCWRPAAPHVFVMRLEVLPLFCFVFALCVSADCGNGCSRSGDCDSRGQCACWPGFTGADCSLRTCPFHAAFVDTPIGDLNHNGMVSPSDHTAGGEYEVWPTAAAGWEAQSGEAHFPAPCSGAGMCKGGTCACFPGKEGAACQRVSCPSGCSGRGVCLTLSEIASRGLGATQRGSSASGGATTFGGTSPVPYALWDADMHTRCVCDIGYTGIDCASRICPRSAPLDTLYAPGACGTGTCASEVQSFSVDGAQARGTYAIVFTDLDGESYLTAEFALSSDSSVIDPSVAARNVAAVERALLALPNAVTGPVRVSSWGGGSDAEAKRQLRVSVTFSKPGNLPPMRLLWEGTSSPGAHSYIIQPGVSLQAARVYASLGFVLPVFFQLQLQPQRIATAPRLLHAPDPNRYHTSTVIQLDSLSEGAVASAFAAALNSIPLLKLRGARFVADANVTASFAIGGGDGVVLLALPDADVGGFPVLLRYTYTPMGPPPPAFSSFVPITHLQDNVDGTLPSQECGGNGLCDRKTGLCQCFEGVYGEACETRSKSPGAPLFVAPERIVLGAAEARLVVGQLMGSTGGAAELAVARGSARLALTGMPANSFDPSSGLLLPSALSAISAALRYSFTALGCSSWCSIFVLSVTDAASGLALFTAGRRLSAGGGQKNLWVVFTASGISPAVSADLLKGEDALGQLVSYALQQSGFYGVGASFSQGALPNTAQQMSSSREVLSASRSNTPTPSDTPSPSVPFSLSPTPAATRSGTSSPTKTPTNTASVTPTTTLSPTQTSTLTPTLTPSGSLSATVTPTITPSPSFTPGLTLIQQAALPLTGILGGAAFLAPAGGCTVTATIAGGAGGTGENDILGWVPQNGFGAAFSVTFWSDGITPFYVPGIGAAGSFPPSSGNNADQASRNKGGGGGGGATALFIGNALAAVAAGGAGLARMEQAEMRVRRKGVVARAAMHGPANRGGGLADWAWFGRLRLELSWASWAGLLRRGRWWTRRAPAR